MKIGPKLDKVPHLLVVQWMHMEQFLQCRDELHRRGLEHVIVLVVRLVFNVLHCAPQRVILRDPRPPQSAMAQQQQLGALIMRHDRVHLCERANLMQRRHIIVQCRPMMALFIGTAKTADETPPSVKHIAKIVTVALHLGLKPRAVPIRPLGAQKRPHIRLGPLFPYVDQLLDHPCVRNHHGHDDPWEKRTAIHRNGQNFPVALLRGRCDQGV
mmetsp:Transcript_15783/g.45096  ORF Transcript_15783/g.45096 Transcript_15783/m.45096 type:complete len:213 (+) Transcript_15783:362-1000(+)